MIGRLLIKILLLYINTGPKMLEYLSHPTKTIKVELVIKGLFPSVVKDVESVPKH